jgi:hypothetical protein
MTQTALRYETHHRRVRTGRPERLRRGGEPTPPAPATEPATETWGDMRMRHRRERHEAHLRTAEALNDLDQAVRRADRWCDALEQRLEDERRRIAKARAATAL